MSRPLGTGKFGSETARSKRIDLETETDAIISHLKHLIFIYYPILLVPVMQRSCFAAQLAREALETNWLKLEIHPTQNT
jgi:thiazole synthase